jgi:hypothetical protein
LPWQLDPFLCRIWNTKTFFEPVIHSSVYLVSHPYGIYIIWSFTQLLPVLFYVPNLLRIFCTHFGVTVNTY